MKVQMEVHLLVLLVALCGVDHTIAITRDDLYPYGPDFDQLLPRDQDDISSPEIMLTVPIVFFEQKYKSIFVNSNGLVSFLRDIPTFFNVQFPLEYPLVAPLYTDTDTRGTGSIYYRESHQEALLQQAGQTIQGYFSSGFGFRPTSLFIATWEDVGYFNRGTDHVNNYQVVLMTDGDDSYAMLLYPENGIQWIQGTGKNPTQPDARAQSGIISGDGRLYTLRGSGTDQVQNLDRWSNTKLPGMWVFHIGKTGLYDNVMPPDLEIGENSVLPEEPDSCVLGTSLCHSKANCIDYSHGFCCVCKLGYYGNGLHCLQDGIPQRINGKVRGTINEEQINDEDLHSYVVTSDGRAYTAVSRIPDVIGFDMQSLTAVSGIIGWLFARPRNGAKNGYELTGGVLNHTAEVDFPQTGHHITIKQHFLGVDVFNYLRMDMSLSGSIPTIPYGREIEMNDYEEEYTRVSPGLIQSRSTHSFHLKDVNIDNPFTVEHKIIFKECPYSSPDPNMNTLRLKIARNFIIYDSKEQIVRYASTNKVTPLGDDDPCKEGRQKCGEFSNCIVEGDTFRCVCIQGYAYLYEETFQGEVATCVDINECDQGIDDCSMNAYCINNPGSFSCSCHPGYVGDGHSCHLEQTCDSLKCDHNAICVENQPGYPECQCLPGYEGDGYVCALSHPPVDEVEDCSQVNICDPFANCVYIAEKSLYQCVCKSGYTGDGTVCVQGEGSRCQLPPDPGRCRAYFPMFYYDATENICKEFVYGGCSGNENKFDTKEECEKACGDQEVKVEQTCDSLQCDHNAICVENQHGYPECQCLPGYEGDGYVCARSQPPVDEGNLCQLPPDPGHCRAYFPMYYYDATENICKEFVYGGCSGNDNKFDTKEECEKACGDQKVKEQTCDSLQCDHNAICVENQHGYPECQCLPGYEGDGYVCALSQPPVDEDTCDIIDNCSPYAACNYNEESGIYQCTCLPGFSGDGYTCQQEVEKGDEGDVQHPEPTCLIGICWCPEGYIYDSEKCKPDEEEEGSQTPNEVSCNIVNNCHPHAQCIRIAATGQYECHCNAGYEGDGLECSEIDVSCDVVGICDLHASCVYDDYSLKSVCVCDPGYEGDGTICIPTDECSSVQDCDLNAQCVYDSHASRYKCQCNDGYTGDGKTCTPGQGAPCNILNNCHPDATCIYDAYSLQHLCQCNAGFSGDGIVCKPDVIGCNILQDCGDNAECVYDPAVTGYTCQCKQGYDGDGYYCHPSDSCYEYPSICDNNADCIPGPSRQYVCSCRDGFTGDGYNCKALQKHDGNFLLVNQGMSVLRVPYKITAHKRGRPIQIQRYQTAVGIDVDCLNGRVYWSDVTSKAIKSCHYSGVNRTAFLNTDIGSPEGISIDWISRNIYWTDSTKDTIEVANLDSKERKVLFSERLVNPRGIAVHPGRGKIFWTDWNRDEPKIESSNMDGTFRQVFLQENLGLPNSLTIDYDRNELCWADAGTQRIECIGLNGQGRRVVVHSAKYPFGITNTQEAIYWTDWKEKRIQSVQKPGGEINKPLKVPLGGQGKLYGIVAVPENCPRVSTPCQFENGFCQEDQLCLPNGRDGHSCVCADKSDDSSGEIACSDIY